MPNHTLRIYNDMLELSSSVDNPTPIVRLNNVNPFSKLKLYAKLEWYNPFGAVKDRPALNMINDAEEKGTLKLRKLVEPTSGNTGIGLAAIANLKNLTLRATVSSEIPEEKKTVLRILGSEVQEVADTLCPDPDSPDGAIGIAQSLAKNFGFTMLNQYENQANLLAHYKTTGPEIWKQTEGKVTHVVCGLGTCGTIGGIATFLKEKNPNIKIIAVHPAEGHTIPGVRSKKQLKVTKLFKPELYDEIIEVNNKEAFDMCKRLNKEESVIAGPSSGMAVAGALKVLKDEEGLVVFIFPDNIFKYTSYFNQNKGETKMELEKTKENTVELAEAKTLVEQKKVIVVDVRDAEKYKAYHLPGAKHIPLAQLKECTLPKDAKILTVCNHGNASLRGVAELRAAGFTNVKSINDGTEGWKEKGWKVE